MFSRVLKSTNSQPSPAPDRSDRAERSERVEYDPSAAKTRSSNLKSQTSAAPPQSPSKIPVPTGGVTRSSFLHQAKENNPEKSTNYLSFLFPNNSNSSSNTTAPPPGPATPVKVNKQVNQSSNPAAAYANGGAHSNVYQHKQLEPIPAYARNAHQEQSQRYTDEDVHMQTMKNTVNPAMLKQLASVPTSSGLPVATRPAPALPSRMMEDVHMKTQRNETKAERGVLQPWERELLESTEVRRKTTVAQICKWRR
jgi:hypothetical protein